MIDAYWRCMFCDTRISALLGHCWTCGRKRLISQFTRERMKLGATGFLQVVFVASNTVFIAHYALLSNLVTAWLISWIWTFNVKKVAFGDNLDRWFYATGAALGSVAGNVIATWMVK